MPPITAKNKNFCPFPNPVPHPFLSHFPACHIRNRVNSDIRFSKCQKYGMYELILTCYLWILRHCPAVIVGFYLDANIPLHNKGIQLKRQIFSEFFFDYWWHSYCYCSYQFASSLQWNLTVVTRDQVTESFFLALTLGFFAVVSKSGSKCLLHESFQLW